MSRVRLLQGPNLKNSYKGWDAFANNIGQTSQNIINRADNNEYRNQALDNTVKNQDRNYDLNIKKFVENQTQRQEDNNYRNKYFDWKNNLDTRNFTYKKGRDETRDNQWQNQFEFKKQEALKPKVMTPYQEEAIRLRNEATDLKTKQAQQKAIANLSAVDNWDKLTTEGQQQMIDYYNKTGLIPKIDNPWFGDVTPILPLSEEQKKAKENQLAKDFQFLMQ